ncbi:MAG: hypothetical protein IT513_17510, partial [Burkholderiales bacterium]|nr:hypothetical protein [Burkholderiales bacterium]
MSPPKFRHVDFLPPNVLVERRMDGSMVLRSGYPLQGVERNVCIYLRRWARDA